VIVLSVLECLSLRQLASSPSLQKRNSVNPTVRFSSKKTPNINTQVVGRRQHVLNDGRPETLCSPRGRAFCSLWVIAPDRDNNGRPGEDRRPASRSGMVGYVTATDDSRQLQDQKTLG